MFVTKHEKATTRVVEKAQRETDFIDVLFNQHAISGAEYAEALCQINQKTLRTLRALDRKFAH